MPELGDGLGFAGIELVRLLSTAGLFGGFENRAIAVQRQRLPARAVGLVDRIHAAPRSSARRTGS